MCVFKTQFLKPFISVWQNLWEHWERIFLLSTKHLIYICLKLLYGRKLPKYDTTLTPKYTHKIILVRL